MRLEWTFFGENSNLVNPYEEERKFSVLPTGFILLIYLK